MEKQKSLLRKLKRGFYRRQKHEDARRINHQFKVDAGQVYANMRVRTSRQQESRREDVNLRISRMRAAFGYSSGKVKGQGIETLSGSRI